MQPFRQKGYIYLYIYIYITRIGKRRWEDRRREIYTLSKLLNDNNVIITTYRRGVRLHTPKKKKLFLFLFSLSLKPHWALNVLKKKKKLQSRNTRSLLFSSLLFKQGEKKKKAVVLIYLAFLYSVVEQTIRKKEAIPVTQQTVRVSRDKAESACTHRKQSLKKKKKSKLKYSETQEHICVRR